MLGVKKKGVNNSFYVVVTWLILIYFNDIVFYVGFLPIKPFTIYAFIVSYFAVILWLAKKRNALLPQLVIIDYALMSYFLLAIFSLLWTIDFYASIRYLYIVFPSILLYWFVRCKFDCEDGLTLIVLLIKIFGIITLIATIFFYIIYGGLRDSSMTSSWSNHLASSAIVSFPFFWRDYIFSKDSKKYFSLLFCLLLAIVVIVSYSRAGFLALILVLFFSIIFIRKEYIARQQNSGFIVLLCLIIIIVSFLYIDNSYLERLQTIPLSYNDLIEQWENSIRLTMYELSFTVVRDYPIWGIGFGSFPTFMQKASGLDKSVEVHNWILQPWVEMGLTGFLAMVAIVFSLYFILFQSSGREEYRKAMLISVTGLLVHSLFRPLLSNPLWYMLLAFSATYLNYVNKSRMRKK